MQQAYIPDQWHHLHVMEPHYISAPKMPISAHMETVIIEHGKATY